MLIQNRELRNRPKNMVNRMNESPCCPKSSSAFGFASVLDFRHSDSCAVVSHFNLHVDVLVHQHHLWKRLFSV